MDFGLKGKHALVTGGSKGIGKAIAKELAREGVDVVIVSRTMSDLEASAREIEDETGTRVIPMVLDVTQTDQVDRVIPEAAQQLGGLHILVNSGSAPGGSASAVGPIETVNEDDLMSDFDVKFVGALRCARTSIPLMKEQGYGRIINISGGNARNAGNLSGGARNVSMVTRITLGRSEPSAWRIAAAPPEAPGARQANAPASSSSSSAGRKICRV